MTANARTRSAPSVARTILSLVRGAVRGLPRRCLAALAILGAAAVGEEAAPAEATFTLQPVPDGFYLPVDIDLEEHEVHFKKTPDFQGPPTCGAIPLNESVSEFVGFAWDKAANLLYVDENRNLDLTDEPGVVYKSEFNTGNFTGVRFSVQHGELNISYVVDLRLSEPWFCMAVVRSGWKGRVEVNGTPYEVLLADNLDGDLTYEDSFTVKSASGVASAAKPPEEPDYWGLSLSSEKHGVPRYVSLAGRTLAVQSEFALVDGAVDVQLHLAEPAGPLGEIKLAGKNIDELVLLNDGAFYAYPSGDILAAPPGRYQVESVAMAGGWQMDEIEDVPSVSVKQGESVELRVGGPLSQKVEVTRSGNTLMLAHAVQGIGKEGYSNEKRYESPPEFTVYRGDTAVASGQFEYG